jgi:hypothetical protein
MMLMWYEVVRKERYYQIPYANPEVGYQAIRSKVNDVAFTAGK